MKVQSNLQLDLNLEKGRIKEEASCMPAVLELSQYLNVCV